MSAAVHVTSCVFKASVPVAGVLFPRKQALLSSIAWHKYRMKRASSKNGFHQEASHSPVVHVGWIGLTFHGGSPTQRFSSVSRPFLHRPPSFSPQGGSTRSLRHCKWVAE